MKKLNRKQWMELDKKECRDFSILVEKELLNFFTKEVERTDVIKNQYGHREAEFFCSNGGYNHFVLKAFFWKDSLYGKYYCLKLLRDTVWNVTGKGERIYPSKMFDWCVLGRERILDKLKIFLENSDF